MKRLQMRMSFRRCISSATILGELVDSVQLATLGTDSLRGKEDGGFGSFHAIAFQGLTAVGKHDTGIVRDVE